MECNAVFYGEMWRIELVSLFAGLPLKLYEDNPPKTVSRRLYSPTTRLFRRLTSSSSLWGLRKSLAVKTIFFCVVRVAFWIHHWHLFYIRKYLSGDCFLITISIPSVVNMIAVGNFHPMFCKSVPFGRCWMTSSNVYTPVQIYREMHISW